MEKQTTTITASDYGELRDKLALSGLFELLDCSVEIWSPLNSDAEEIHKMVNLIESMINVTGVRISAKADDASSLYRIEITETSTPRFKRRERR